MQSSTQSALDVPPLLPAKSYDAHHHLDPAIVSLRPTIGPVDPVSVQRGPITILTNPNESSALPFTTATHFAPLKSVNSGEYLTLGAMASD